MSQRVTKQPSFQIEMDFHQIPQVVDRIRQACGNAYSAFSGRPISLCKSLERRGELRIKFEEPIYLWPVDVKEQRATPHTAVPIVAVTRDISPHGVGFHYDEPIATEHVLAEFDLFGMGTERLLVEIRWSRKIAHHAFEAGGLIVGVAVSEESRAG